MHRPLAAATSAQVRRLSRQGNLQRSRTCGTSTRRESRHIEPPQKHRDTRSSMTRRAQTKLSESKHFKPAECDSSKREGQCQRRRGSRTGAGDKQSGDRKTAAQAVQRPCRASRAFPARLVDAASEVAAQVGGVVSPREVAILHFAARAFAEPRRAHRDAQSLETLPKAQHTQADRAWTMVRSSSRRPHHRPPQRPLTASVRLQDKLVQQYSKSPVASSSSARRIAEQAHPSEQYGLALPLGKGLERCPMPNFDMPSTVDVRTRVLSPDPRGALTRPAPSRSPPPSSSSTPTTRPTRPAASRSTTARPPSPSSSRAALSSPSTRVLRRAATSVRARRFALSFSAMHAWLLTWV